LIADGLAMTERQISGAEVFFGTGDYYGYQQGAVFSLPVGVTADQVFILNMFAIFICKFECILWSGRMNIKVPGNRGY